MDLSVLETAWDQECTCCDGSGKNPDPADGEFSAQDLRLRKGAKQFLSSATVARRLAEIKEEWQELKEYAAANNHKNVYSFDEYVNFKLGEKSPIAEAHTLASKNPDCKNCNGTGKELTETGRQLLAFLKRWPQT
ncbi:hypothetical protein D5S17_17940 [Pseudonocardiaceae bacterium YIM PH 21723]|nr:hypothetical protein D5S17_17940 [Pseudonocardiaceae bacterium YIM PH 21723]